MSRAIRGGVGMESMRVQPEGRDLPARNSAGMGMNPKRRTPRHDGEESTTTLPGYRQSEVGSVPEDWEITTLGALGRPLSGGTPRSSDARFWNGDIPWVSSKDMKVTRLDESIDHVTPLALGNGTRLVQPGTILMVVRGMSLVHSFPVAIVDKPVAFNQDLKAFVPNAGVDSEFVLRWLEFNQSRLLLLTTDATHGTKRIPTPDLLASHVPLPQPAEQHAISKALSDVDELLGALDALIAKKRAVKQAATQQLLTGRVRLPGFNSKWATKGLKELGVFSKGSGIKRDEVSQEGLPCIRYGEIYTTYETCVSDPVTRVTSEVASSALPIRTGDILFAGSGETVEEIGRCIAYLGGDQAYAGGDIVVLTPVAQNSLFLGYLLNHSTVAAQKARLAQGDAVVHIHAANLAQVQIALPSIDEQTAIAAVLFDMDAEIEALERRLDKVRAIKHGMMEQLLTGRVRLV